MKSARLHRRTLLLTATCIVALTAIFASEWTRVSAHIVPPEKFHPVAASYRRMMFLLNLNPVLWPEVQKDAAIIAGFYESLSPQEAAAYRNEISALTTPLAAPFKPGDTPPSPAARKDAARQVFDLSTRAVSRILVLRLESAEAGLGNYSRASRALNEARQLWAAFDYEVKFTDRPAFARLGSCWLEMAGALGSPGVLSVGYTPANQSLFQKESREIVSYVSENFGPSFHASESAPLAPLPARSATFDAAASIPPRLPPGADINKQLPRPRQILNMTARGVDESETALIALGDMAFDSPFIFGEPARSLQISCNTCHNKSITNPNFFIPGLSSRAGGMDVSNSFFAPHANNGHFDALDIPDLRGIRFLAPYGRNGRFASLREFIRNVIVSEFNGPEPDPIVLDGMLAYMLEFDFLPNPALHPDGTLSSKASASARRGEILFNTRFASMGNRSCATCHVPSDNFVDRKRHDIGATSGAEPHSRDRALDTPTLLGIKFTAPYFHNGSAPTLRAVSEYFNKQYKLGLTPQQLADLTAYLETVGDGADAVEATTFTLEAEMQEFSFFLSAYEYLRSINKPELINTTFQTIALEIRAHKWDLQDQQYLPTLDRLAELMDQALAANQRGDRARTDACIAEYRKLYAANVDHLK